ncbi:IS66 family transposase, partial [Deinococcus saxicola]|uniref:IS66 family transposase n=2 Tax=Deinococcus saxicola TaxID=249406 RepID=UPI0039EEFB20
MAGTLTEGDVLEIIRQQTERFEQLEAENHALRAENARLKKKIEELERKKHSKYAAPFSREARNPDPQPPGRRAGVGIFTYKTPPEPEQVQAIVSVPIPNTCANCGYTGKLIFKQMDKAWITDLKAQGARLITEYHVPVMTCPICGQKVRGEHADLAPDQCGATAHRHGARLQAVIQTLRHEQGIPERRLPRVLELTTGIRVTQGAINQAAVRLARDGGPLAVQVGVLEAQLQAAPYVHHDDTGWRMNGVAAWMSAFLSNDVVLYRANPQHTNAEVRAVLGDHYAGTLVADRFSVYDSHVFAETKQQKCLAHLIRNADEAAEGERTRLGRGERYARRLAQLFRDGIRLHSAYRNEVVSRQGYAQQGESLTLRLDRLLNRMPLKSKTNERLRQGLLKQHLTGRLLYFLLDPEIPPTNNAAERALRSVVMARKVSQCSKNLLGAITYTRIKSVVETARLRGEDPVSVLMGLQRLYVGFGTETRQTARGAWSKRPLISIDRRVTPVLTDRPNN